MKNMTEALAINPGGLQLDLLEAENVNVQTAHDGRLWICVDGVNVLRVKRCLTFTTDLHEGRQRGMKRNA